jgi:glucose-6-phosphate isomerase
MQFVFDHTSGIAPRDVMERAQSLDAYRSIVNDALNSATYDAPESSVRLPFDLERAEVIVKMTEQLHDDALRYVVVVGIGGSNLGTRAIYEALRGPLDLLDVRTPKLLFLDTVNPELCGGILRILSDLDGPEQFIVLSVSKSGGTAETIVNTEALLTGLAPRFGDIHHRLVVVTDRGSKLWSAAASPSHRLAIPERVGGRYSVLSAVGIFPLHLAGLDVSALHAGARDMANACVADPPSNPALQSASLTYLHYQRGLRTHNSFLFHPSLASLGLWYRQLMGESIGKEHDLDGAIVREGIVPIVSIGSTDLHSMAQLFYGGPQEVFTNIIIAPFRESITLPPTLQFPNLVANIEGKSYEDIMDAIIHGVAETYVDAGLPFATVALDAVSEYELGAYLQFRMIEMMYLAQLLHVNAFDQPAVEAYKKATKFLLAQ